MLLSLNFRIVPGKPFHRQILAALHSMDRADTISSFTNRSETLLQVYRASLSHFSVVLQFPWWCCGCTREQKLQPRKPGHTPKSKMQQLFEKSISNDATIHVSEVSRQRALGRLNVR